MSLIVDFSFKPLKIESQPNLYFQALITGGIEGLSDFWELFKHPIDHAINPGYEFLRDCVILSSTAMSGEDFCSLALKDSRLYSDAYRRMEMRAETLKEAGIDFKMAEGPEKVRMISRLAVNIFLPGTVVKGAKYVKAAKVNYEKFGVFKSPDIFEPLLTYDLPLDRPLFKSYNAHNIPSNGRFIYVITAEGKLLVGSCNLLEPVRLPGGYHSISLRHHELASAQPVVAAGQVVTKKNRSIELIDNKSGHYQPRGSHLKELVESVFEKHGFQGSRGAFEHSGSSSRHPCINLVPKSPLLPLALERSIQAGCLAQVAIEKSLDFQEYYSVLDPVVSIERRTERVLYRSNTDLVRGRGLIADKEDSFSSFLVQKPKQDKTIKDERERLTLFLTPGLKSDRHMKERFKPDFATTLRPLTGKSFDTGYTTPMPTSRVSSRGLREFGKDPGWGFTPMPTAGTLSFRNSSGPQAHLGPNYLGPKRT